MIKVFKCPSCGASLSYEGGPETTTLCQFCNSTVVIPAELRPPPETAPAATPPRFSPDQLAEVKSFLLQGNKLEAIKALRVATGIGLKEAKEAVEALERGEGALITTTHADMGYVSMDQATRIAEILELARADNKIGAIKLFRETFNVGLKEAKDAVEAMTAGQPPETALYQARQTTRATDFATNAPTPTRPKSRGSCLGVLMSVIFSAFIGVMVFGAPFRLSGSYQPALDAANADPTVIAALGSPITASWWPITGELSCGDTTCSADYQVAISGPDGSGTLSVNSRSKDSFIGFGGTWELDARVIVNDEVIAYLEATATPEPTLSPAQAEATSGPLARATAIVEATAAMATVEAALGGALATATALAHEQSDLEATAQAATTIQTLRATAATWPVVISDTFTNNKLGWPVDLIRDNSLSVGPKIVQGQYVWTVNVKRGNSYLNLIPTKIQDLDSFYVAVDLKMIGAAGDSQYAYGLVFRHLKDDYGFFGLFPDGSFRVLAVFGSGIYQTVQSTSTAAHPKAVNRLAVYADGKQFVCEINGEVVYLLEEDFVPGGVGLGIDALTSADSALIEFDNFEVRAPQP